ncbi:MAG: DUF962 domain-containing protein [Candidatus Velthaea sp.]|jgi:hypothetical protein
MDDAFWLRYLRAHADPRTRALHLGGTLAATATLAVAFAARKPAWLPWALVAGYGPAWFSHAFIEHNRPETFSRPFSSLAADYRMAAAMLTGSIDAELARAGAGTAAERP